MDCHVPPARAGAAYLRKGDMTTHWPDPGGPDRLALGLSGRGMSILVPKLL